MQVVNLIKKKRDGGELSRDEIAFLIGGHTRNEIPDYQMSAFLMAVFYQGMSPVETAALTEEMIHSGQVMDLSDIPGKKVDKHSTGGVGDKTSLILAPLVAAAGVPVPMISGRGLGHSGGTLDKLESIPGFRVNLTLDEYRQVLKKTGLVLIGQTAEIAPADKKLYALRDVTATIESIPLIAGSIMSKKLAEGIDGLILDVKTGSGAFMKTYDHARQLAKTLVGIGQRMGKQIRALITDIDQPLGRAVGNSLEVIECLETLKGQGPPDLTELSVELAAHMVELGERAESVDAARALVLELLRNGRGLEKFRAIIEAQGGDPRVVDDYSRLPKAQHTMDVKAARDGFIGRIDAEAVGWASVWLGAGRQRLDSVIDAAVGVVVHRKVGEAVHAGEPLCTIHYNASAELESVQKTLAGAFAISNEPPPVRSLVQAIIY
jgi:pyrimidine-nucleoside phosphorylase